MISNAAATVATTGLEARAISVSLTLSLLLALVYRTRRPARRSLASDAT
jgi:hypothetical protein